MISAALKWIFPKDWEIAPLDRGAPGHKLNLTPSYPSVSFLSWSFAELAVIIFVVSSFFLV